MPQKTSRVIIDTNLWVSFLLNGNLKGIELSVIDGRITLLFSDRSLNELSNVINRPKLKKYFNQQFVDSLLRLLHTYAEFVVVSSKVKMCRDPKDDFLLSLAIDAKADYLITGDKDLLVLKNIHQTKIVTIAEFLETL